ncbi:MAG: MG2 domain-containing protein [Gemmataceae bacterium]|nr:MG2 domain-containing protein [Gemmataceae bacterium]
MRVGVGLASDANQPLSGTLLVELLDAAGRIINRAEKEVRPETGQYAVGFNLGGAKPDQLSLRVTVGKQKHETAVAKALLLKAHETSLTASTEFVTGSRTSVLCGVHGVASLTDTVPLPGSEVRVQLKDEKGGMHQLYAGKVGGDGLANIELEIPAVDAGQYELVVTTRSALGEETLTRQVRLKADAKILLVSDKPIYQPGQLMHLRALVLRSFDQKPVGAKDMLFEIEDSKGNKVFKKTLTTNEFGVAAVDFQLADEVNMGDYHIRATLGEAKAEKTVNVKRYVLPKFKVNVKADKTFYLPKETIKAELQSDYFFGKPVAKAKVEVTASTFDVAFRKFHEFKGETDENGHAKFEITLPDYFVGQPLQKGDAIVKLDIKVHDSADHTETISKSYTVSDQPIRLSLIAEGGKLVPGMENRLFVAAIYPDGSPAANCDVKIWHRKGVNAQPAVPGALVPGPRRLGRAGAAAPEGGAVAEEPAKAQATNAEPPAEKPLAVAKTNAAGLAEITLTPKNEQFRQGQWGQRDMETLGGKQVVHAPAIIFDVFAEAKDPKGNLARANIEVNSHPLGENVLLRLDKAVYQTGDVVNIDIRTSAGLPTVFVDVVRGGQIMLSRWLEVKDGKATQTLDLPPSVYGSLEIHAYQMLAHGEIIRDSRVVYVQPKNDLKIDVQAEKQYAPGEDARIRFIVTDAAGKPTQAALGVIVVDEAVYALQDMQPGLEKVYFTLQEELLKPNVQIKFSEGIDNIIAQPVLPAPRQQVAEVLLTAVKLPAPQRWNVAPAVSRKQRAEQQVAMIGTVLFWYAIDPNSRFQEFNKAENRWVFRADLLDELIKTRGLPPQSLEGVFGGKLTLDDLTRIVKTFTPERLGRAATAQRLNQMMWTVIHHTNQHAAKYRKGDKWELPADILDHTVAARLLHPGYAVDAWGQGFKLVKRDKKNEKAFGNGQFAFHDLVSSGPDGKFGTKDDVTCDDAIALHHSGRHELWWLDGDRTDQFPAVREFDLMMHRRHAATRDREGWPAPQAAFRAEDARLERALAAGVPGGAPPPAPAAGRFDGAAGDALGSAGNAAKAGTAGDGGAAPITKVREYFPETMLWQPALITDSKGIADLGVTFADSITTWRLSASANAKSGALGGVTVPLKVFQDFFVDIDLPVALTQGDELAFPVAIYNYLQEPQKLKIELEKEAWFELLDSEGLTRTLNVNPGDVTFVRYRIKANKLGHQPLTVKAYGSKKSDAVKRLVEVVPNGQKVEKVATDRLTGKIKQTIEIPADAIADASKLFVRIYPGVMAQVVDGLEGMLRMPCGCFEQTSSAAYPNIMIVDYIKRHKIASPQMLLKAEQYLNVGYQRLLTFERPGGGFDWWGSGEPLIWLSAYGLQEFSDMARVWPIDRGIIDRTQQFLMRKMDKDHTWSNIGATHGETIASMGNPKLLLTGYVVWSLLESGMNKQQLAKSVDYIRTHINEANDNAYILALVSNALAAYDPKDDSTLLALQRLDKLRKEIPEWKAINFPARGTSLTYARGDSVTIETTALAAIAMARTGQFTNSVNQALTYLVKVKEGNGTWGSTQATILALKALMAGMGANQQKEPAHFVISVNGKEAARGKVDADNADVMQSFDLKGLNQTGANEVTIEVTGESNLMYQIVGRYFQPWKKDVAQERPPIEIDVTYDRTKLSTNDILHAKATLKYHGKLPTYMVMVDLGIAPGFSVDPGDFAEMVGKKQIQKFSITSRQVILYLGDVKPGDVLTFEYTLKPRYPLRARTAPSVAYEYNTPANRAEARPVELIVEDRK